MKRLLLALLLLPACGGNPPPPGPEPCKPVPAADPKFTWESPTTLELTWVDMPVTVGGGDEKCVLNRRLIFNFDKPVKILTAYSFQAADSGDSIEMLTVLYAKDGEPLYKRSEHVTPGMSAEYDAFDPPQPVDYETDGLILDAVCRVTGNNKDTGELNARCHLAVYVKVEEGTSPPPPSGDCTLDTPKASDAVNPEYKIQRQSKMIVTGTPVADFGKEYYCDEEVNWPEACAAGRVRGPVAPDGHPQRLVCEQQFNEQPCPTYMAYDPDGHISFDPWFVIGGVNQNHPKNVAAGCGEQFTDHESWVKVKREGRWYIQSGMWYVATVHGNTKVMGCIANGAVCGVSSFRVDN